MQTTRSSQKFNSHKFKTYRYLFTGLLHARHAVVVNVSNQMSYIQEMLQNVYNNYALRATSVSLYCKKYVFTGRLLRQRVQSCLLVHCNSHRSCSGRVPKRNPIFCRNSVLQNKMLLIFSKNTHIIIIQSPQIKNFSLTTANS